MKAVGLPACFEKGGAKRPGATPGRSPLRVVAAQTSGLFLDPLQPEKQRTPSQLGAHLHGRVRSII